MKYCFIDSGLLVSLNERLGEIAESILPFSKTEIKCVASEKYIRKIIRKCERAKKDVCSAGCTVMMDEIERMLEELLMRRHGILPSKHFMVPDSWIDMMLELEHVSGPDCIASCLVELKKRRKNDE